MKISHRIFLLILVITLLSTLTNLLLTRHQARVLHFDSERLLAHTLVQSLRAALVEDVIGGNKLRVTNLLRSIKEHDNPIEFLYVTDTGHQVYAHSFKQGFPRYLLHQSDNYQDKDGVHLSHKYQTNQGLIYEYSEALIPGLDATLHIGIDQTYIVGTLAKNTQNILLISLATMLLALLIAFFWSKQITRPLARFARQIQRFGSGESVNFAKPGKASPEIRQLSSAFQTAVSERQQALNELQEREQNLAITLNSIGDAVITTDAEGNITRMNPIAEQLTGWSFKEAEGQPLKAIFPIIDVTTRKPIENPVEKVIATGETVFLSNHTTLVTKDGAEYQIADSAAPIRNGEDNIQGMVLVFNDVTERYQLREAAAKSADQVRLLLNSTAEAIYGIDATDKCTFVNQSCLNMLGYEDDTELLGKHMHDLIHYSYPDGTPYPVEKCHINQAFQEGHETHIDDEVLWRKDGSSFAAEYWAHPIFKEESCIGAVVTFLDITAKKQTDEIIRRSQKMDALGKLTGGIAHDFNNMLGVVLGYAGLLQDVLSEQPELAGYVRNIQFAGKRGAKLTKKLLDFSRQKVFQAEVLNINNLLRDEKHMLEKTLTARIQITLNLDDDLWPVWLDSGDLEDAILNMGINAMHAIEGNGQLTIQTSNEQINAVDAQLLDLEPGDYVLLRVIDTGCGMDEETKALIFDPFYTTKGEKGTGLGLSQVYGFVERSGGAIKVYSELHHGSQFVLYFPRHQESDQDRQTAEKNNTSDIKGTETILVVDDEPALLSLAVEILSRQGYRVLYAEKAKKALGILEHESVDLLLSDVIMPGMDGYELAAIVQKKYPDIKIQMVSGFGDDRHLNSTDESLHPYVIHKPYRSQAMLKRIRELLDNKDNYQQRRDAVVIPDDQPMKPIEWAEQFTVGIPQIDEDHKLLLSLANRCITLLNSTEYDGKEMRNILDKLVDYTQYHFQREELLMRVCEYPDLIKHQQAHQLLIEEIGRRTKEYDIGTLTARALLEFLIDWLTGHIMGMDKAIAPWCEGKETSIKLAFKNFRTDRPKSDS